MARQVTRWLSRDNQEFSTEAEADKQDALLDLATEYEGEP